MPVPCGCERVSSNKREEKTHAAGIFFVKGNEKISLPENS